MMGIGIWEMMLIAGIALVVIGPEKFPDFAKIVIRTVRDLRGYVDDVKHEVQKELRPLEKEVRDLTRYKPEDYIDSLVGPTEPDHTASYAPDDDSGEDKDEEDGAMPAYEQDDYVSEYENYNPELPPETPAAPEAGDDAPAPAETDAEPDEFEGLHAPERLDSSE